MQRDNDPQSGRNHRTAAPTAHGGPGVPEPSGASGGGPVLSRRSMMKAVGLGAAAIAGPGLVAGCFLVRRVHHQDRVRGDQARGHPVLQQPGREVQRVTAARGRDPRLHHEPHRGVRARQSARHRLRQLQPDHVHLRRPGRAGQPGQLAAGQAHRPEHPGAGHPVRLIPRRDERAALLGGRLRRHLQRGSVRQGRRFVRPDHPDRIPRRYAKSSSPRASRRSTRPTGTPGPRSRACSTTPPAA